MKNTGTAALLAVIAVLLALQTVHVVDGYTIVYDNDPLPTYSYNTYRQHPFRIAGVFGPHSGAAKVSRKDGVHPYVDVNLKIENAPHEYVQLYVYNAEYVEDHLLPKEEQKRGLTGTGTGGVVNRFHPCMDVGQAHGVAVFNDSQVHDQAFTMQAAPVINRGHLHPPVYIKGRIYLKHTGLYVISLNSCRYINTVTRVNGSTPGSEDRLVTTRMLDTSGWYKAKIKGNITVMNPYGGLLGQQFGYLPAYITLFLCAFIMMIAYLVAAMRVGVHRLLRYHWMLIGVCVLSTSSYMMLMVYFSVLNLHENFQPVLYVIANLLLVFRAAVSRGAIFFLCSGWGVVRHRITYEHKCFGAVTSALHWLLYVAAFFLHNLREPGTGGFDKADTPGVATQAVSVTCYLVEVLIIAGCGYVFRQTVAKCEKMKLKVKLTLYRRMKYLLVTYLILAFLWWCCTLLQSGFSSHAEDNWQLWWLRGTVWELLYFCTLAVMLCLWMPNRRSLYYYVAGENDAEEDEAGVQPSPEEADPEAPRRPARRMHVGAPSRSTTVDDHASLTEDSTAESKPTASPSTSAGGSQAPSAHQAAVADVGYDDEPRPSRPLAAATVGDVRRAPKKATERDEDEEDVEMGVFGAI